MDNGNVKGKVQMKSKVQNERRKIVGIYSKKWY